MGVVTRSDSPYYQLNLERGRGLRCARRGTTIRHSTGDEAQDEENRRLAHVEYHHAMAELARGRLDLPTEAGASRLPTLAAYLDSTYRAWLKREHPRSATEAIDRLDRLFVPTMGHLALDRILPAVVEQWRKKRRTAKVSAHTIGRELSDLRGLLTNAVELGDLARSPLAGLKTTAAPSREIIRYLDKREERRLYQALAARDEAGAEARARFNEWRVARHKPPLEPAGRFKDGLTPMVILTLNTGVRPTELFLLRWSVIDWQARTLTVEWWTSKGRKTRRLALNHDALSTIKTWRKQSAKTKDGDLIFPAKREQPYTAAPSSWDTIVTDARLANFRWYDLRHTFASKLVQRGINLYVVKDLMGHASIKSTERYAHLAPSQGRAAVNSLNSRTTAFAKHFLSPRHTRSDKQHGNAAHSRAP